MSDAVTTVTLPTGPTVAYRDAGGGRPALLLSHGFLLDQRMFDGQVEALRERWRVVTWDERGHGRTTHDGPFTYWDAAADALALLDHLGIDEAVLGGMSQGGFLSLRVALLAPRRVRGLVLMGTQAGTESRDLAPLYEAMHRQWAASGPTEELARTVLGVVMSDDSALVDVWLPRMQAESREGATARFRCLMDRDDITPRLAEIAAPSLVIHGTGDAAIPLWKAEQLAAGLPGALPIVVVQGGHHAVNLTHPGVVNTAIDEFMSGL